MLKCGEMCDMYYIKVTVFKQIMSKKVKVCNKMAPNELSLRYLSVLIFNLHKISFKMGCLCLKTEYFSQDLFSWVIH